MREAAFVKANLEKWQEFEKMLDSSPGSVNPDRLSEHYITITDDLSFARAKYPTSQTTKYLNNLAGKVHLQIYKNKKVRRDMVFGFWRRDLPLLLRQVRWDLLYAFLVFGIAIVIGVVSAANDEGFTRLILGDGYVNMTINNIEEGDPLGVYKHESELNMFFFITLNNIRVAVFVFIMGLLFIMGSYLVLMYNGIMVGVFSYLFYEYSLGREFVLTVFIHGTIELIVIVVAGAAGIHLGRSFVFPDTHSRGYSLRMGMWRGAQIIFGLFPFFIVAGFLESFVTRHTEAPDALRLAIILGSLGFMIFYLVYFPWYQTKRLNAQAGNQAHTSNTPETQVNTQSSPTP